MNRDEIPRTAHEICYFADIKPKTFWNIEKILNYDNEIDPKTLVSRVVGELSIPFSFCPEIMMNIYNIGQISCAKPATIVICSIYLTKLKFDLKITLTEISNVCDISETYIKTLYNRMKDQIY
jgi:transcription initiation factor TFIIIB Brf1 subunit/transcription initiation factor TFIIB